MSISMSHENLQGINWSVERRLVIPGAAMEAGREVLDAIAVRDPMILFDHHQPQASYAAYQIEGLGSLSDEEIAADADFGIGSLLVVKDAIRPFKDPDVLDYDFGLINVLGRNGKVPLHPDNDPWSLVFVGLLGEVGLRIKHINEPVYSSTILRPGDALRIINPPAKRQRPRHELVNLSDFARVSYGEFTSK